MNQAARALAALAFLGSVAVAQSPLCITGVVEAVGGFTICMQGETHRIAGTRVYLRSALVNLNQHVGQLVHITGSDIGITCRVVDVFTVSAPRALLTGTGSGDHTIQIPAVPALAGVRVWFQGARQDIGPVGPPQLTNVVEILMVPFMPVCGPVNC